MAALIGKTTDVCQCECEDNLDLLIYYDKGLTDVYFDSDPVGSTAAQQQANCKAQDGTGSSGYISINGNIIQWTGSKIKCGIVSKAQ